MNAFTTLRKFSPDRAKGWVREHMPSDVINQALCLADIYYRHARSTEPLDGDADEMYGAFLCLWQFIQQRPSGKSLVRAYNPTQEEHQWHSTHSVIEILSDDMPFLVSSIIMALDRQELHIHDLIHPVINVVRDPQGKLLSVHDHNETVAGSHFEGPDPDRDQASAR